MPEPRPVNTIVNARWVVTVDAQDSILENQSIVIDKGKILAILPQTQQKFIAQETIDLREHVLMPGLINAHTHAAMTLFRGLADDLPLTEWLNHHIWPTEARWVSENFVRDGAQLALAEMIRSGTTCFSDMYFFPNVVARVARDAQLRAQITFPVMDVGNVWASNANDCLHKGLQLLDDFRNHPLIQIGFGPHAPYTVSDPPLQKVSAYAAETNTSIQMHVHETAHEVQQALAETGERPLQRLYRLGLLSPQMQTVHMTQLNDDDIHLLAQTGSHVVHCPESNLKLASGFCPVAKLLAAGVNVALGTDGAASNNDLDIWGEMRTAALLAKGASGDPAAVPAETALRMATINGAKALGIDNITGSLEPGKWADMIALKLDGISCQPFYHLPSQLVYATPSSQITDSWVAGKPLMKSRQLTTLDLPDILARAKTWQTRIAESTQQ